MTDPVEPALPAAIADAPQASAMEPPENRDAVRKMTHEVETGDMFVPGGPAGG